MKRKLKSWVYVLLLIIILLIIGISFFAISNKGNTNNSDNSNKLVQEEPVITTKDIINNILEYPNSDYDEKFLTYIGSVYGDDTLNKLLDSIKNNTYNKNTWHLLTNNSYIVLQDMYQDKYVNNSQVKVIEGNKDNVTISFAGDISLADNWEIMPYYKSRGKKIYGVLSEETVKYMVNSDLMIINNEFCFSNRGTPLANKKYTFRANPKNVSIYDEIGVDMVTLANNHVYDYGRDAFLDTLDTLKNYGMPYIGAGRNIDEASRSYYFVINGYKIAFINASRAEKFILTPGAAKETPGVFRAYDTTLLKQRIKEEKTVSDYVVVLMHWGREDSHVLEDVIKKDGKAYVDMGADLIVGSHAHVLQGMEIYKNKLIAYNLGDFLFSHVTDYTGILTLNLSNEGSMTYKFIPAYEKSFSTKLISGSEASKVYNLMTNWSINVKIDNEGNIVKRG